VALDEEEFGISADPALTAIIPQVPISVETKSEYVSPEFVETEPVVEVEDNSPKKSDEPVQEKIVPVEEKKVEVLVPTPAPVVKSTQEVPQATDAPSKEKTEEEKRANRAAKFGIQKKESEIAKDKLAARAERFGLPTATKTTSSAPATDPSLEEKKRVRAERFGLKEKKEETKIDSSKVVS
jgi:hypothetical protein